MFVVGSVLRNHILTMTMVVLWLTRAASGFFFSSQHEIPRQYAKGERVDLMVNRLTSSDTLVPLDYYYFPFCIPEEGFRASPNASMMDRFGDYWAGDRKFTSPYILKMKEDAYCEPLCLSNLGRPEQPTLRPNRVAHAIRNKYHHHWSVDHGLPAGKSIDVESNYFIKRYSQGFPMGYRYLGSNDFAYIYNHVNIEIFIEPVEQDQYRIVRFMVQPLSINHEFEKVGDDDSPLNTLSRRFQNPIDSCNPEFLQYHTTLSMVSHPDQRPQRASGTILFTYDVIWTETTSIPWSTRWDIYVTNDHNVPDQVHTYSITNSVFVLLFFGSFLFVVVTRVLRQSVSSQESMVTSDGAIKNEELDLRGWRAVSGDVFRPPSSSPMLLAVFCGTGAQLLFTVILAVLSLFCGWLTPTQPGKLVVGALLVYVFCGGINGYVTARLLKTFQCTDWSRAMALAAFGFPGFVLVSMSIVKILASWWYPSTLAISWAPIASLLVMVGVAALLLLFGASAGYQQDAIDIPVVANIIPRPIPRQPLWSGRLVTLIVAGFIPFAVLYVELFFLMVSLWLDSYYYTFGFLLSVLVITVMTIAVLSMILTFFQLQREDYCWWWRSFFDGGSVALFALCFAVRFYQNYTMKSFSSLIIYFGYMVVLWVGLFLTTGFLGLATSFCFNLTIFSVKRRTQ